MYRMQRSMAHMARATAHPLPGIRQLNSLAGGNPMFPHRNLEPITPAAQPDEKDKGAKKGGKKGQDDDFWSRHGGKVGLGALAATSFMLYSYFVGQMNQKSCEDGIADATPLEPYEVTELRYANNLTYEIYEDLLRECRRGLPERVRYAVFTAFVTDCLQKKYKKRVSLGHLIDRVVQVHLQSGGSAGEDLVDRDYLLTVLNILVNESATQRVALLHRLAAQQDAREASEEEVHTLISRLATSAQIPPQTQSEKAEVKYPAQTYRRKTPAEMTAHFKTTIKAKDLIKEGRMSAAQIERVREDGRYDVGSLTELLLGRSVCVWNECNGR